MCFTSKKGNNKNHPVEKTRRRFRLIYLKALRLDDPPHAIATGAAIGVFMGILPTFGLGIILAVVIAALVKANKASAVLGSLIMNPLTTPLFWTLSAFVGSLVFWEDSSAILERLRGGALMDGLGWAGLVYMTGNIIVSTVFSVLTYWLLKKAVERHRARKAARRTAKAARRKTHLRLVK
ncbi:MAG TPA: DUF2062 domain-containing protein [Deltaproteobacteria bacterium]|nr:DUF2062 domain-containing protein [Deltaproteobacteria bacterium]